MNDTFGIIARREFDFSTGSLQDFSERYSPFNWQVGLTLSIPITHDIDVTLGHEEQFFDSKSSGSNDSINVRVFHPESQKTALYQARVELQNAERELQDLLRSIADEVRQSVDEVVSARMKRDSNEKARAFSREEHRIQKKRFELGMNTFSELIEARGKDLGTEIELSRSHYDIYLALMGLANKVGAKSVESMFPPETGDEAVGNEAAEGAAKQRETVPSDITPDTAPDTTPGAQPTSPANGSREVNEKAVEE
jgi:outer membrane protein TolC